MSANVGEVKLDSNGKLYVFDGMRWIVVVQEESHEVFVNRCFTRVKEITKFLKDNYPEDLI